MIYHNYETFWETCTKSRLFWAKTWLIKNRTFLAYVKHFSMHLLILKIKNYFMWIISSKFTFNSTFGHCEVKNLYKLRAYKKKKVVCRYSLLKALKVGGFKPSYLLDPRSIRDWAFCKLAPPPSPPIMRP